MPYRRALACIGACLTLLLLAAAQPASLCLAAEQPAAAPKAPAGGRVAGFRSASFGMDEAQLRRAIAQDFPGQKIAAETSATEKTVILSLRVAELIPDTGPAHLFYVLGFKSKKLIQVNVVWSQSMDANQTAGHMVSAANILRDYFLQSDMFDPSATVANATLPDGNLLVFRGKDSAGHVVALALSGIPVEKPPPAKDKPALLPQLTLSYILDPAKPDVFRLEQGQF